VVRSTETWQAEGKEGGSVSKATATFVPLIEDWAEFDAERKSGATSHVKIAGASASLTNDLKSAGGKYNSSDNSWTMPRESWDKFHAHHSKAATSTNKEERMKGKKVIGISVADHTPQAAAHGTAPKSNEHGQFDSRDAAIAVHSRLKGHGVDPSHIVLDGNDSGQYRVYLKSSNASSGNVHMEQVRDASDAGIKKHIASWKDEANKKDEASQSRMQTERKVNLE
jgi:hypothetical protein